MALESVAAWAAVLLLWFVGAVSAGLRRELVQVGNEREGRIGYALLSRLRRLRDDPLSLALRVRVARGLAAAGIPAAIVWATGARGGTALLVALVAAVGVALTELSAGGIGVRWLARFRGGALYAAWSTMLKPPARLAAVLLPLRARRPEPVAPGWVQAEETAASIPSGGNLGRTERRFLRRLLASTGILVHDIMTPWNRVHVLEARTPLTRAARVVHEAGHSRLPVIREGKAAGMISVRDLVGPLHSPDAETRSVEEILRPLYFARQNQAVKDLLDEFQEARVHLAVVLDRLGRPVGVVTMEDILEEIVGELHDERERGEKRFP